MYAVTCIDLFHDRYSDEITLVSLGVTLGIDDIYEDVALTEQTNRGRLG